MSAERIDLHPVVLRTILVAACLVAACAKGSHDAPAPAASSVVALGSNRTSEASPPPAPPPSGASAPTERSAWSGSYIAKVGPVEPPANAKEKTWAEDPGSSATGKGTVDTSVAGPTGDVSGDLKGPLGEMLASGIFDGKELRAHLAPKTPKGDAAMTGFMLLSADGASMKGTLRVSSRDARIVREAQVELAKK